MRDTYVVYDSISTQNGWDAFKARLTGASACDSTFGCYFDDRNVSYTNHSQLAWINSFILGACGTSACPGGALLYDATTGKYGYASGASSGFTRKIKVIIGGDAVQVNSTVSWTQGSGSYSIVFSGRLLNWIE
jgi:hypothetical protein